MLGHIVHINIIPFTEMCVGGIQYHLLCCDEFSTNLQSFPRKTKSHTDVILGFTTMIAFYKQYGYTVQVIQSDHETTILSAQIFLNQQGIQVKTIAPYQHEQKLELYTIYSNN